MDDGGFQPDQEHKGSGTYAPGNPDVFGFDNAGGGTGCHFDPNYNAIDQQDAYDTKGNLVQDANCQCNYAYKGDWKSWVWAWINNAQNKDEFPERNWLAGGSKAPSWAMDSASCWMNNPRDMIELQNEIFWASPSWNNRAAPKMDETSSRPEELRKYWGWNEVPVARWIVDDVNQWDAVIVKLPAAICDQHNDLGVTDSPSCLGSQAQLQLEKDLDNFVQQGKLVPGLEHIGDRPGSYVLFVREYGEQYSSNGAQGVNWQRFFFCESWVSPNKKYQIVYRDMESDPQGNGGCFIDYGGTPSPPPSPPSPPSPSPGPAPGPGPSPAPAPKGSIQHLATRKCLTLQDGHLKSGQSLFAQECTGDRSQKWKLHDGALVYTGQAKGQDYCVDAWSMQSGNSLQIWECNGLDQQQWGYDAKMKTFFLSTSGDASLCMDLANGDTVVQVWDCIMNDNQLWTYQIMEDDVVI